MSTDEGSDDEDFDYSDSHAEDGEKRFPIHDACEFGDIEALRAVILEPVVEDQTNGDHPHHRHHHHHHSSHHHHRHNSSNSHSSASDDSDDESDENDSTAAAHAAATGHSPSLHVAAKTATAATAGAATSTPPDDAAVSSPTHDDSHEKASAAQEALHAAVTTTPRTSNASNSSANLVSLVVAGATPMPGTEDVRVDNQKPKSPPPPPPPLSGDSKLPADATAPSLSAKPAATDASQPTAAQEENQTPNSSSDLKQQSPPTAMDTTESKKSDNLSSSKEEKQSPPAGTASDAVSPMEVDQATPASTPDQNGHAAASSAGPASAATSHATQPTPQQQTPTDDDKDEDMPPPGHNASTRKVVYRVPMNVNLNERDLDENTPLHVAIHARKLEHVKLLLELGASFRLRCDGSFPLHTAISLGSVRPHQQFAYECVVALHEAGSDLTLKDESNHTPLFLACMMNLPQIVSYILSNQEGLATLNARADRAGNRPLHAAAKYDTASNRSISKSQAATATGQHHHHHHHHHHHPDGSVIHPKAIPGFPGKQAPQAAVRLAMASPTSGTAAVGATSTTSSPSEALLTHVLLGTVGIDIDGTNALGQTALHVACSRGNWPVARLLLQAGASPHVADRRGFTPGQLAYKRGMPIPADLLDNLGDPPESGVLPPVRDLIVDPNGSTLVLSHELCILHRTCPPVRRDSEDPPPENVRRLSVLVDAETGILRSGEFGSCIWNNEARRVAISDVLKVHEYSYVESISQMASSIADHPNAIAHLDPDTAISRWSFEAAMRAAGSVCQAVDQIVVGDHRNAFCAVRPPGHHAGPRGIVKCANDPEGGSHGFCLLNNVAIGAAYARSMYRNEGIRKVAIIDFDVHHGNGTEQIIRQLVPTTEKSLLRTPFAFGEISASSYKPWLDETDIQNVFFASTHGYGNRGFEQAGWFYPASGKTHTSEAISHPAMVEHPNLTDFLLSQTWTRMGEDSKANCCKIINVGLELPENSSDPQGRGMKQRLELRDTYRNKILPHLREFDPDLIFISAGFDAHRKDTMNFGYVGMVEDDYEWVTEQLVKVANTCCNGRVISVLEGGYKIHGGIVSPFARSVASHVRALVDGGRSRELYDSKDMEWESQYERHIYEKRERKKEEEREKLRLRMEASQRASFLDNFGDAGDAAPEDPDAPSRKRRRNQVDYKELFKQMQQEGFANG